MSRKKFKKLKITLNEPDNKIIWARGHNFLSGIEILNKIVYINHQGFISGGKNDQP
jgi:hypothetical protein